MEDVFLEKRMTIVSFAMRKTLNVTFFVLNCFDQDVCLKRYWLVTACCARLMGSSVISTRFRYHRFYFIYFFYFMNSPISVIVDSMLRLPW